MTLVQARLVLRQPKVRATRLLRATTEHGFSEPQCAASQTWLISVVTALLLVGLLAVVL